MSSSVLMSNSSSVGPDGVESVSYHDADSSKTTLRLTLTVRVEGLKHLHDFFSGDYPMRIHSLTSRQTSLGFVRDAYICNASEHFEV